MNEQIRLTLSKEQAQAVSMACEVLARLYMGQRKIVEGMVLPPDSERGIASEKISDTGRQAWDVYQVVRHFLAWDGADNTPETRRWPEQMQVYFDEPMRTSVECELPKCEKS